LEHIMANVRVEQRNAHLASPVRVETVAGRDGGISKATLTAISNNRRGRGEDREDEPTALQWTLWGKQAENAAQYLGKGSHVNICGRLRNNHYKDATGNTIFGFDFTCEEIDYLDSRAESDARRAREQEPTGEAPAAAVPSKPASRPAAKAKSPAGKGGKAYGDDDVPF
jgi:single stranded DNA-binding protein